MGHRSTIQNGTDIFDLIADAVLAREASWRLDAACRDKNPEVFFPKQTNPMGHVEARKICTTCPVIKECQGEWETMPPAMQRHGVWWGTTDRDRRAMRK